MSRRTACFSLSSLLCLLSWAAAYILNEDNPEITLLEPLHNSLSHGDLRVSWSVKRFAVDPAGRSEQPTIFLNGLKVHSSVDPDGSLVISSLSEGSYRMEAMLATYDEDDGLTSVLSNHVVEFHIGSRPAEDDEARLRAARWAQSSGRILPSLCHAFGFVIEGWLHCLAPLPSLPPSLTPSIASPASCRTLTCPTITPPRSSSFSPRRCLLHRRVFSPALPSPPSAIDQPNGTAPLYIFPLLLRRRRQR